MFGMPSMIELDSVADHVKLCAELGLSFVELNTNFPNQQLHLLDSTELKNMADSAGIFYTIHLNDELYIADFNPHVASGYCNSVLEAIEFAKQIGAPVLNMHLCVGAKYTMPDKKVFFYEAYEEDYLAQIVRFRDLCMQAIGDAPVRICIENTTGYLPFQKRAIAVLLECPVFGLTYDIGHNRCSEDADEEFILANADRLHHMHLHDVLGDQDHLPFGEGEMPLADYIALAQNRTAVIEVKTVAGLCKAVDYLKR